VARKSKLAEILAEVAPSDGVEDTILSGSEAASLIRRAYRAGRASIEQGELLAAGWLSSDHAEHSDRFGYRVLLNQQEIKSNVKVEVRRAKA